MKKDELVLEISSILNNTGAYNKIDFLLWKESVYKIDYDTLHHNHDCDIETFIVEKFIEAINEVNQ